MVGYKFYSSSIDYKPGTMEHIQGLKTKLYEAGHSKSVLCDNQKEWGGQGHGRGVQDGRDTCIAVADSYRCMAKTITIL